MLNAAFERPIVVLAHYDVYVSLVLVDKRLPQRYDIRYLTAPRHLLLHLAGAERTQGGTSGPGLFITDTDIKAIYARSDFPCS
jgi:hypothetical protein